MKLGGECRELLSSSRCNYPLDPLPPDEILFEDITICREVFDGTVPANGACDRNDECAGSARCVFGSGGSCAGTCTPRQTDGGPCMANRDCGTSAPNTWSICYSSNCVEVAVATPGGLGAPCGHFQLDLIQPCADDLSCPTGGRIGGMAECVQSIATGQGCLHPSINNSIPCAEGACIGDVCTPFVIRETAGGSCARRSRGRR